MPTSERTTVMIDVPQAIAVARRVSVSVSTNCRVGRALNPSERPFRRAAIQFAGKAGGLRRRWRRPGRREAGTRRPVRAAPSVPARRPAARRPCWIPARCRFERCRRSGTASVRSRPSLPWHFSQRTGQAAAQQDRVAICRSPAAGRRRRPAFRWRSPPGPIRAAECRRASARRTRPFPSGCRPLRRLRARPDKPRGERRIRLLVMRSATPARTTTMSTLRDR